MKIEIAGENAVMITFADREDLATSALINGAAVKLKQDLGDVLIDMVPGFTTLLVVYQPRLIALAALRRRIRLVLNQLDTLPVPAGKLLELPVYYSAESGPDLELVARQSGLTTDEVIHCHSSREYRVMVIGFVPGFAYLGELDERLALPRLASPRLKVPRGAVAIANRLTAVYPRETPGGWNLLGLCPTNLFDPSARSPLPFAVGDRVRFSPVSRSDFLDLEGEL